MYLLIPKVLVLYLSMNLNSSLLILCGETFFSNVILKWDKSNESGCTDLACIESADDSHLLLSVKQLLCVFVRSCDFCIVLPM